MFKYFVLLPAVALANLADLGEKASKDVVCAGMEEAECELTMKAFSGSIGKTISQMNEYGCWCYFGDDHGRGKGQPQDAIDEMCKVLHDGYECAMRDAEDEGTTCVPWEVAYTSAVGGSGLTIAEECVQVNSGSTS
jgi:hypothetical protein